MIQGLFSIHDAAFVISSVTTGKVTAAINKE